MQRHDINMPVDSRRKYKRYSKQKMTYLGLIVYAIQNSPEKRLTVCELLNSLTLFVDGDRKGLENNIRVCLSLNKCFVKVPINPECPNAKRNFWKVDDSKITPKMLRRHFSRMQDIFPNFHGNMGFPPVRNVPAKSVSCKDTEAEKKFTGPFSIESLLQRESSTPMSQRDCPPGNLNVFLAPVIGDNGLACKRKTWDYPSPSNCVSFSRSHSYVDPFPHYNLDQIHDGCRRTSLCGGPSKRICSVSELSYHCTASENINHLTSNYSSVMWPYI